ncbi:hypothetical protein F4778DRAFT_708781 [Xylariomycetidae sp. FL2044]|nr:hypothetical protein F4778DRAFT_708781 [Xylariomycetidae sp. FL2044]
MSDTGGVGQSTFTPADIPPEVWAAMDHSRTTGPSIIVAVLCIILAITVVSLRIYTRRFLIRSLGIEDYLIAVALAGQFAVAVIQCIHTDNGLGTHIWDLPVPQGLEGFFKVFWFGMVFYNITLFFIKLSLFFQYYRFIQQIQKYRNVYLGIMAVVTCWTIGQIFMIMLMCVPVEGYWNKSVQARCIPEMMGQTLNSVSNIITDVIVLTLPMPVVWALQLRRSQKWSLIGIFGLGFITCIISILRLIHMKMSSDISFDAVHISCWSLAEITTGIICASLPTLRPLAMKWFPALKSTARASAEKLSRYRATTPHTRRSGMKDLESGGFSGHKDIDIDLSESRLHREDSNGNSSDVGLVFQRPRSSEIRLPIDGTTSHDNDNDVDDKSEDDEEEKDGIAIPVSKFNPEIPKDEKDLEL